MKTYVSMTIGFCLGLFSIIALLVIGLFSLGPYLVVNNEPVKSDSIVVLGGGESSRLKKAVALHDKADPQPMILVDRGKSDWNHIAKNLCDAGVYEGTLITCLEGSTSTATDAALTLTYYQKHRIKKILIVTDPYHSRRAKIIFNRVFKGSGIEPIVVHSGYYGNKLPPQQQWWKDIETMQAVWVEFGKILYYLMNTDGRTD